MCKRDGAEAATACRAGLGHAGPFTSPGRPEPGPEGTEGPAAPSPHHPAPGRPAAPPVTLQGERATRRPLAAFPPSGAASGPAPALSPSLPPSGAFPAPLPACLIPGDPPGVWGSRVALLSPAGPDLPSWPGSGALPPGLPAQAPASEGT